MYSSGSRVLRCFGFIHYDTLPKNRDGLPQLHDDKPLKDGGTLQFKLLDVRPKWVGNPERLPRGRDHSPEAPIYALNAEPSATSQRITYYQDLSKLMRRAFTVAPTP